MANEITLLTIYDRVAGMDAKLDAHIARTGERLDHSQRKLDDHEERLRAVEAEGQRGSGRGALIANVATFLGSSTAAAVVSYLISHH